MEEEKRNLTDADIKVLAQEIERTIVTRFQLNVGKGVIAFLWKQVITIGLLVAAYGAGGGFKKWGG